MKKILMALGVVLALGACAGSNAVVTIDGVTLDLDDIPVTSDSSTIDDDTFRNALNWVIRDQVLTAAAEDEFGITFSEAELNDRAALGLSSLDPGEQDDPRANLSYFLVQARVGRDGLMWEQVDPLLPDGTSQNEWAIEKLSAAEVEVNARYGEWRVSPEPLVYEP
jgi:hypothetical protein